MRARLKQLGACVVERDAKGAKKLAPTHVIVPEGTEKGQLIGLDVLVRVRTESWLIKRCRALDAGTVAPPPREAVELARTRYLGGEDDLTVLLQAQSVYSGAERLAVQAQAAQLQQLAALYKALGGGWEAAEGVPTS